MQRGNYPTSRLKVSGYFHQLYQARLAAEVAALQKRYPIRVTYGG
jgi:hypothetical protein